MPQDRPVADPGRHPAAWAAGVTDAEREAVLRTWMSPQGFLRGIPAKLSKRLVLLDVLAQDFVPGERYMEPDVNDVLRRYHDDVAALRRYLVDYGFMAREHGWYWRTGGSTTA